MRNARAANQPRIAYSVKWASFLVMMWMERSVSALVFGNNQSTSGPIIREVFPAEKLAEEAKEIKASQAISGRYRLKNLRTVMILCFDAFSRRRSKLERGRAGNDFDDLVCDRRLPNAIHVERQAVDQLARIL